MTPTVSNPIVQEITIEASAERVFEALINPEERAQLSATSTWRSRSAATCSVFGPSCIPRPRWPCSPETTCGWSSARQVPWQGAARQIIVDDPSGNPVELFEPKSVDSHVL
jgi:hypothetical protein